MVRILCKIDSDLVKIDIFRYGTWTPDYILDGAETAFSLIFDQFLIEQDYLLFVSPRNKRMIRALPMIGND